jgi:hypothetical protein
MARVRFDAVPLDYQNNPARIFDAGEKFDAVGTGVVGPGQKLTKDFNVFVAFVRLNLLYDDFMNHAFVPFLSPSKPTKAPSALGMSGNAN